jgi:hypothetical protein
MTSGHEAPKPPGCFCVTVGFRKGSMRVDRSLCRRHTIERIRFQRYRIVTLFSNFGLDKVMLRITNVSQRLDTYSCGTQTNLRNVVLLAKLDRYWLSL